jgi:hypothetical protein
MAGLAIWRRRRKGPVKLVQRALSDVAGSNPNAIIQALDTVIRDRLWQTEGQFESFTEFTIALPPSGLGVRSIRPLKLLRYALVAGGHIAEWTEVLERVARLPGRPRKTFVNDEGFQRFYKVPTAATAPDRLLPLLKRNHTKDFAAVCKNECSIRQAGIRAGLIAAPASRYGGACNIAAAAALNERAQGRLLCDLFGAMRRNAQCMLIARQLEPHLGFGLAQRWREAEL